MSDPVADIERAMVRIRRSVSRRGLGRLFVSQFGHRIDLGALAVIDGVEEGAGPDGGAVTVGEVAARAGVDPSRASRMVAEAIAGGYVRRVADQGDGRRVGLELTDLGRSIVDEMHALRQSVFGAAMASWSARERAEFARLLSRFVGALESRGRE